MAKRTMSVEQHYTEGRHHPYGRNMDFDADRSIKREPSLEPKRGGAFNRNDVQDPEDAHDNSRTARYDNDASGWVRGARGEPTGFDETATGKPSFDKGNAWRQPDGSIHGPPGEKLLVPGRGRK